jgi:hypothetical protein
MSTRLFPSRTGGVARTTSARLPGPLSCPDPSPTSPGQTRCGTVSAGLPKLPALSSRAALLASPRLSFQHPQLLVRPAVSAPVRHPAAASSADGGMQLPGSNLACQGSSERWQGRAMGSGVGDGHEDAGSCDLDSEASSVEVTSVTPTVFCHFDARCCIVKPAIVPWLPSKSPHRLVAKL